MSDLALMIGGLISAFAVGWMMGKFYKSIRQFFDSI